MAVTGDLSAEALAAAMPGRAVRAYPALLSTEADARAWARAGGPAGGVVVADYQASARGRGGLPWQCRPELDLGFTLILRPELTPDEEGWLYVAASLATCEVLGGDATAEWPDRVSCRGRHAADIAAHAGLERDGVGWAVVNVLVVDAPAPRGALLGRIAAAVERLQQPDAATLASYAERCTTLGRDVEAHLIPTWPDGVRVGGVARRVLPDGALVVEESAGRRVAVRPQHLARLELAPIEA